MPPLRKPKWEQITISNNLLLIYCTFFFFLQKRQNVGCVGGPNVTGKTGKMKGKVQQFLLLGDYYLKSIHENKGCWILSDTAPLVEVEGLKKNAAPQLLSLLINIPYIRLCILPSTWKPITVEKSTTFSLQSATTGMPASTILKLKFAKLYTGWHYSNVNRQQISEAWIEFASD